MHKPKILVVEDEIIIADTMCDALNDLGFEALEPALNYTEAIATIEKEKPDFAILDINLSGRRNGIDVAKQINEKYEFPFIFLTSFSDSETVSEAKKHSPSAFLVKPFSKEELFTSIEIGLFNYSKRKGQVLDQDLIIKDSIFIKDKGAYKKINFNEILYIKSDHVYIEINMFHKKKHIIRCSLNDILIKLSDSFIRVHRSFIINSNYLQQLDQSSLKIGNVLIPISKKYRQTILEILNTI